MTQTSRMPKLVDDKVKKDAVVDGHTAPIVEPREFKDTDWHRRVLKAKEARRAGQMARKGKSAVFSSTGYASP